MIKLFCKHEWQSHEKKERIRNNVKVVPETEFWYNPRLVNVEYSETTEILICKKCGKIETIKY